VQTVDANQNQRLSALLEEYERQTGIPVLVNTSLNGPGEPIVDSVQDGVEFFLRSGLDALVIGDHVIRKRLDLDRRLSLEQYVLRADWIVESVGSAGPVCWRARSAQGETLTLSAEWGEDWRALADSGEICSRVELWPSLSTLWNARALRLQGAGSSSRRGRQ
jgi:hypothetical protein